MEDADKAKSVFCLCDLLILPAVTGATSIEIYYKNDWQNDQQYYNGDFASKSLDKMFHGKILAVK